MPPPLLHLVKVAELAPGDQAGEIGRGGTGSEVWADPERRAGFQRCCGLHILMGCSQSGGDG